jgi:hypothetical protein
MKKLVAQLYDAKKSSVLAILLALCAIAFVGCATNYRFGQSARFAPDIKTVYVPMFESDSFRRNLGERLMEAVCKRIETDTPFKVVNDPHAQTILQCKIAKDSKRQVIGNRFGDMRNAELNFQVLVSWKDQRGEVIREEAINIPASAIDMDFAVDVGNAADLIPEYGRSVASTQQEVINDLSGKIIGLMEVPW